MSDFITPDISGKNCRYEANNFTSRTKPDLNIQLGQSIGETRGTEQWKASLFLYPSVSLPVSRLSPY